MRTQRSTLRAKVPNARTRVSGVKERLVWIDCEMTGLDVDADALIEVAALVTDFDLNVLGDGVDIVVKPPAEAIAQMGDYVRTMHEKSGLLAELDAGVTLAEAEERVLAYVKEHCPTAAGRRWPATRWPPTGSFLARDMPTLEAFLHYRIVDVSSIKELARRWYPRAYFQAPAKRGNHRALADIQESIEELRYYREAVFVPPPRPGQRRRAGDLDAVGGSLTGLRRCRRDPRPSTAGQRFSGTHPTPLESSFGRGTSPRPHGGCSSAGRAPRCGRGCRGFKSRHSPQGSGNTKGNSCRRAP